MLDDSDSALTADRSLVDALSRRRLEEMNLGGIEHQLGHLAWLGRRPALQRRNDLGTVEGADDLDLGAGRLEDPNLERDRQCPFLSRLPGPVDVLGPDAQHGRPGSAVGGTERERRAAGAPEGAVRA